jgi:hypothetical protein
LPTYWVTVVQHSLYIGKSHRRKGTVSHVIDKGLAISLAYPSGEEWGL